jgi:hypothetical protein
MLIEKTSQRIPAHAKIIILMMVNKNVKSVIFLVFLVIKLIQLALIVQVIHLEILIQKLFSVYLNLDSLKVIIQKHYLALTFVKVA